MRQELGRTCRHLWQEGVTRRQEKVWSGSWDTFLCDSGRDSCGRCGRSAGRADVEAAARPDVRGRRSDHQVDPSWLDAPTIGVPDGELGGGKGEGHFPGFTGRQSDTMETTKLLDRTRNASDRITKIELDDFVGRYPAGVAD